MADERSVKELFELGGSGSGSGHVDVVWWHYRIAGRIRAGVVGDLGGLGIACAYEARCDEWLVESMLNPLPDITSWIICENVLNTSAPLHFHALRPAHGSFGP